MLRLVGARLADVEGGGTSYRYGGEEFCVLFPERTLDQAMPKLEKLRREIEVYRMTVRGPDRPKDVQTGTRRRVLASVKKPPEKILSVTVSIGAAEPTTELTTPALVIRAADEALYRAKHAGRNRVSR